MNEIFETLPDTDAGEDENPFEMAVTALTNYFKPKKNREYEVYVFRKAKQESDESIAAFHTRLRRLAITCEFENTDRRNQNTDCAELFVAQTSHESITES